MKINKYLLLVQVYCLQSVNKFLCLSFELAIVTNLTKLNKGKI